MQASYAAGHRAIAAGVAPGTLERLRPLLPRYSGIAEPGVTNRRPGKYLKTA